MDYSTSKSRYIISSLAIIIVITAFILVGLNAYLMQKGGKGLSLTRSANQEELDAAYKQGYQAARDRADIICDKVKPTIDYFYGTVASNDGKKLVVTQNSLMADPKADGVSDDRTVLVTTSTKIVKNVEKSEAQFNLELKNFEAAQAAGNTTIEPPDNTYEQTLKLSDLKVGSKVMVIASQDVTLLQTITATVIRLQSM